MKIYLLGLLACLLNTAIHAQNIKTVADLGNKWLVKANGFWQPGQAPPGSIIFQHIADTVYTIIDSVAYTKINYHYDEAIYIRYDNNTHCLYGKPVNNKYAGEPTETNDEFILMNGNLNVGDTLILDNIKPFHYKAVAFVVRKKKKREFTLFQFPI